MKFLFVFVGITITWIILTVIGARGPPVNVVERFGLKICLVSSNKGDGIVKSSTMISSTTCSDHGQMVEISPQGLTYDSRDVIFFVTLPIKRTERKMSRLYQYMIVDMDLSFKSEYVKKLTSLGLNGIWYQVSIGYRNHDNPDWRQLVRGNATRLLQCDVGPFGTHSCDHLPLFELWSCHYDHYIINIRIPFIPVSNNHFDGILSVIKDMTVVEIHQHPQFTTMWFIVHCVFFVMSLLVMLIYRNVLINNKFVLYLVYSLVFINAPFELLSLYFDVPWMVLLNDFRHGLFIGGLCIFFTIFISKVSNDDPNVNHLSSNWCTIVLIMISCFILFVYEFCERGIQVFKPFYSIWGNRIGQYASYFMIAIASILFSVFVLSSVIKVIRIIINIRQSTSNESNNNKEKIMELLGFVALTTTVCAYSIIGYILPTEVYLLHWFHEHRNLSLYGALLLGSFGLWNAYVFGVVVLYTRIKSNVKLLNRSSQ